MDITSYILQTCGNMCQQTTKFMHAFYMHQAVTLVGFAHQVVGFPVLKLVIVSGFLSEISSVDSVASLYCSVGSIVQNLRTKFHFSFSLRSSL
jgi:hypothetical protein